MSTRSWMRFERRALCFTAIGTSSDQFAPNDSFDSHLGDGSASTWTFPTLNRYRCQCQLSIFNFSFPSRRLAYPGPGRGQVQRHSHSPTASDAGK